MSAKRCFDKTSDLRTSRNSAIRVSIEPRFPSRAMFGTALAYCSMQSRCPDLRVCGISRSVGVSLSRDEGRESCVVAGEQTDRNQESRWMGWNGAFSSARFGQVLWDGEFVVWQRHDEPVPLHRERHLSLVMNVAASVLSN